MKKLFSFALIAMAMFAMTSLESCSSKDDDPSSESAVWKGTQTSGSSNINVTTEIANYFNKEFGSSLMTGNFDDTTSKMTLTINSTQGKISEIDGILKTIESNQSDLQKAIYNASISSTSNLIPELTFNITSPGSNSFTYSFTHPYVGTWKATSADGNNYTLTISSTRVLGGFKATFDMSGRYTISADEGNVNHKCKFSGEKAFVSTKSISDNNKTFTANVTFVKSFTGEDYADNNVTFTKQ